MSIRKVALIAATTAVLAWPSVAAGQSSVPPGSSELDQYVPTAPHTGGDQQAGGPTGDDLGGTGAGGPGGAGVGGPPEAGGGGAPSTVPAAGAGGDGDRNLLVEPAATARSEYLPGLRPAANAHKEHVAKGDAGSPVGATLYTLTGGTSGGLGFVLPMLLGASLALCIVYALRQRRYASGR